MNHRKFSFVFEYLLKGVAGWQNYFSNLKFNSTDSVASIEMNM